MRVTKKFIIMAMLNPIISIRICRLTLNFKVSIRYSFLLSKGMGRVLHTYFLFFKYIFSQWGMSSLMEYFLLCELSFPEKRREIRLFLDLAGAFMV